jgi:hypothetical protein
MATFPSPGLNKLPTSIFRNKVIIHKIGRIKVGFAKIYGQLPEITSSHPSHCA